MSDLEIKSINQSLRSHVRIDMGLHAVVIALLFVYALVTYERGVRLEQFTLQQTQDRYTGTAAVVRMSEENYRFQQLEKRLDELEAQLRELRGIQPQDN